MASPYTRATDLHRETAAGADADRVRPGPRRVARRPRSATDGLTTGRTHRRPLPADLLAQASRRLEAIALVAAALWIVSTILYHVVDRAFTQGDTSWLTLKSSDALVCAGVATSLAVYFYLRRHQRDPEQTLNIGLAYMIVTAIIAGVILHWDPVPHSPTMPVVSWLGILVLLFAATLPADPVKSAVAGLHRRLDEPDRHADRPGTGNVGVRFDADGVDHALPRLPGRGRVSCHLSGRARAWASRSPARAKWAATSWASGLAAVGWARSIGPPTGCWRDRRPSSSFGPSRWRLAQASRPHVAVERFHREAEAAARLQSPHTVGVYDFGATEDGTLYIVMELLDGMDLESLVRHEGPLPAPRVVHILRQVCESLEEAHASGLVHRDIKPANLHIGRFGLRDDFVKVLDFGLVTAATAPGANRLLVTAVGSIPGTPAYMAPEMIVGDHVDGRADLYALGCVAYFLLTGQLVFEADNALQSITKRLQETPVPPSQRTELPVPPDLDALVLACLAAQPSDRPATAGEVARRLAALSLPRWTDEEAARWWAARFPPADGPPNNARVPIGQAAPSGRA